MSLDTFCFAVGKNLPNARQKLVLLALADSASDDVVFCSDSSVFSRFTSQPPSEVEHTIDELIAAGILRRGVDKHRGSFLKFVGMPDIYSIYEIEPVAQHYVYRVCVEETGEFYIGVRTAEVLAEKDPYLGSGVWPKTVLQSKLKKVILGKFQTREEAERFESIAISANILDPLCRNKVGGRL